jgi:hypothetical protein
MLGREFTAKLGRSAPRECEGVFEFGCLTIESETGVTLSSRTSERSERDPGPITTNVYVARAAAAIHN